MNRAQKRQGYALAIGVSVAVLAVRFGARQPLGEQALLLPFVLAVIVAAARGGLGPGLLATGLCAALGVYFLVPPTLSLVPERIDHFANALIFIVIGVTVSALCEALHQARRRDTEKQFRTLADSIPQLVWMARPDGYRFWFNKRWCEFTGTQAAQLQGAGWHRVHVADTLPRVLRGWQTAIETGRPWEDTFPLLGRDGQTRWFLARAVPIHDERGHITCWFGTNTDISERYEMEEALRESDRRKDEFLATLAHELRGPLAPISYALDLWPSVVADPAEMEHSRLIMQRQVRHLGRLIDDLLDVSRIANGKIRLSLAALDVREVLARAIEVNRQLLDGAGHQLALDTSNRPIVVRGDAARLTQVFSNILNNAAKYTPRGGTISVSARGQDDQAVVSVQDTGPGIPKHMLAHVFEMFEQVDKTLERASGGLGIGLTLVKQLVELHGGTVEARSEGPGEGCEIVLRLPLYRNADESQSPAKVEPGDEDCADAAADASQRRVLIVDDQRAAAETLGQVMRFLGHDVAVLLRPTEALDTIERWRPDVVLLDISMPGMSGYELARHVRADAALDDVVLVALTGYGRAEDRQRALDVGFDDHLVKPVSIEALKKLLAHPPRSAHATHAGTTGA